jgi:HEAT repeat protein
MRKRLAIAVAVLLFAALVATVWQSQPPREPVYQGRTLSYWLYQYIYAVPDGYGVDPAAKAALRTIGTNSIPFLLDMLRRPDDSPLRLQFLRLESMIHRRHMPFALEVRYEGIAGFDALGAEASNAVPALIRIHQQGFIFRIPAVNSLGAIGPPAGDSVPILLSDITNASPYLRLTAIQALGKIHSRPQTVVPALTNAMLHESPPPGFLMAYFDALAAFGPAAKPAIPALRSILNAPTNGAPAWMDAYFRQQAAAAIQKIDPQSAAR